MKVSSNVILEPSMPTKFLGEVRARKCSSFYMVGRNFAFQQEQKSQDTDNAYLLKTDFIVIAVHILSHLYIILTISILSLTHIISFPVNIKRYIHRISAFRNKSKQSKQET